MSVRGWILLIFTIVFSIGCVALIINYLFNAPDWASYPANGHIYTDAELTGAGTVTDSTGRILVETKDGKRVYNSDVAIRKATLHAVGDTAGFIETGLQSSYWKQLCGYNIINGTFQAAGRGNNIQLTLNADLCVTALKALGNYKGAVGVYNYKTGEVLCMVSTPTYDIENPPDLSSEKYTGVYLNRFLSASYPPGSTFKLITAAAAIETFADAQTREYTCKKGVEKNGEWISCMGNHGTLSLKEALQHSCNAYFSQLAADLGADTLQKYAEKMGFNKTFYLDGIAAKQSEINLSGVRDVDIAWAGMGQYTDMANPLQYLTMIGAIANGGVPVKPYFIDSITSPEGIPLKLRLKKSGERMINESTAELLSSMMRNNVKNNYGDGAFGGLNVCAKTGTAEVINGVTPHSWFVGFAEDENLPLAFVVVVEHAGAGVGMAKSVAAAVLRQAKDIV